MINHGGKRKGAGRKMTEKTKQMRVPVGAANAIKSLLRLYKNTGDRADFVVVNIILAKSDWVENEKGDYLDYLVIKDLIRALKSEAEILGSTDLDDPLARENFDKEDAIISRVEDLKKLIGDRS
ncbi:MAG: hypothetical protein GY928_31995 [Colwellia sp.]|nr:hypothetical protein [Colwellia sp.]